jgi:hypothetical protein
MLNGDATWAIRKMAVGWIINTVAMTIKLPSHRIERLFEVLNTISHPQK